INLPGDINSTRLPSYSRLDLGLRRDWRVSGMGRGSPVPTAVAVPHVLGQTNILGLVARTHGGLRRIPGGSRALPLELGRRVSPSTGFRSSQPGGSRRSFDVHATSLALPPMPLHPRHAARVHVVAEASFDEAFRACYAARFAPLFTYLDRITGDP